MPGPQTSYSDSSAQTSAASANGQIVGGYWGGASSSNIPDFIKSKLSGTVQAAPDPLKPLLIPAGLALLAVLIIKKMRG